MSVWRARRGQLRTRTGVFRSMAFRSFRAEPRPVSARRPGVRSRTSRGRPVATASPKPSWGTATRLPRTGKAAWPWLCSGTATRRQRTAAAARPWRARGMAIPRPRTEMAARPWPVKGTAMRPPPMGPVAPRVSATTSRIGAIRADDAVGNLAHLQQCSRTNPEHSWRWGESNPRLPNSQWDFSERSR